LFAVSALLLAGAVACSSSDSAATIAGGDAGSDAPAAQLPDPGPPDGGGNSEHAPRDAASDAPVFTGPTSTLAAATDALGAAECAFLERCFTEYTNEYTGSLAGCSSGAATQLRGDYASGALFDKTQIDATVACYGALTCDALYGTFGQTHCPAPKPVNGAASGAACNQDNDCASSFCSVVGNAACGTCAPGTPVNLGDACRQSPGQQCPAGSVCNSRCVLELGPGQACTASTAGAPLPTSVCASGLSCVSGTCTKSGGPGTACGATGKCDTFQMQVCDSVSSQCTSIEWLASGAACVTSDDAHMCGGGLRCIAPANTSAGTCGAAVQPGQACAHSSSCSFGYDCKSNVCTAQGSTRPMCN
jgi:hypothetical protein